MIFRSIIEGSRIRPPGQFPRNSPLDNCFRTIPTQDNYPLDNCSTDNFYLGQLRPGQLPHEQLPAGQLSHRQVPPRTIAPRTIPQDNSHLWLLYCPPIITPGNYHREQWQLQITIFSWLFSVSFPWPNYIVSVHSVHFGCIQKYVSGKVGDVVEKKLQKGKYAAMFLT